MQFSEAFAVQDPTFPITFEAPDATIVLDVAVTRGGVVESRHRVHAAVVDADGRLRLGARNPRLTTWWRSCAKPFQVMPTIERGYFDQLAWGSDELALACASHGGEPEHVSIAGAMLAALGLEAGDLACGAHEPLSARGARLLRESGHPLTRLHNNCSGKHAAMLALATRERWPAEGYEQHDHAVQRAALAAVARWTGLPPASIARGVDGCGVTVFALPLANMALAYARLVQASASVGSAAHRIVSAMTGHPFLVGGSDRFDSLVMDACRGRVVCKIGAEGVHSLGLVQQGLGIALKVEDGSARAQYAAVLALLDALGELPEPLPASLRDLAGPMVWNTRGEIVGEVVVSIAGVGDAAPAPTAPS